MARSSADALRRTRMFISTNHRVITVGKMMVRTLVIVGGLAGGGLDQAGED